MLKDKNIVLAVTGSIAAYKIANLASMLKKLNCNVDVLMTQNATNFINSITFETLTGTKCLVDTFDRNFQYSVEHISIAKKADLVLVAPASANVIGKLANGIADDMLTTTFLAAECPKLIVPAMNTHMLMNPITQDNLAKCRHYGMHVLESDEGYLACGDVGSGRMPEPAEIEDAVKELLVTDKYLTGKKVLITAGPTQEAIDPVRYLTNHSPGKMGFALARTARNAGAEVTLVAGRNTLAPIRGVNTVNVASAQEMADAVLSRQEESDAMILAAAVADYTPVHAADEKIHKSEGNLSIECRRTVDILASLGQRKRPDQILIGFSMETENMIERTKEKLQKKNCDYIVGNNLNEKGAGFGTDTNRTVILSKDSLIDLGLLSKDDTASEILRQCLKENA